MAAARCSSVALVLLLTCCCSVASTADEKLTHLHFYFHEVNAGEPNATVVNVANLHKYFFFLAYTHSIPNCKSFQES